MKALYFTRKIIFCLAVFVFYTEANAVLSGIALLDGQTNHAGIKVKFTATPGTAVTDSCFTDAAGNFSVTITGGVYKITYSKQGYQTWHYNNSGTILLTNSTVLPSYTLAAGYASYQIGNVSGYWSDTATYYIQGDVVVPANATLTIAPGTKIKFLGNYKFIADGALKAQGTPAKRILFTLLDSTVYWDKLDLNNNGCILDFCTVEYAMTGIRFLNRNPVISNCIIRFMVSEAIYGINSSPKIVRNEIYNFKQHGIYLAGSRGLISCNHIHHGNYLDSTANGTGISATDSIVISNNNIHSTRKAIDMYGGECLVKNNYIHDNGYGIMINCPPFPAKYPVIANNTFRNHSSTVIYHYSGSVNTKVINNIIIGCPTALANGSITCDHNLVYNCTNPFVNLSSAGIGQLVATNSNGDSIDSYFNLFMDPQFVTGQEPHLQTGSPAQNAGNTVFGPHMGADAPLICYSMLTMGANENKKEGMEVKLFPNPNAGSFTIELLHKAELTVYNILGKIILSGTYEKGKQQIEINGYESGIYFVNVKEGDHSSTVKIIKE